MILLDSILHFFSQGQKSEQVGNCDLFFCLYFNAAGNENKHLKLGEELAFYSIFKPRVGFGRFHAESKMAANESSASAASAKEQKLLGTEELSRMSCTDFSEFKVCAMHLSWL